MYGTGTIGTAVSLTLHTPLRAGRIISTSLIILFQSIRDCGSETGPKQFKSVNLSLCRLSFFVKLRSPWRVRLVPVHQHPASHRHMAAARHDKCDPAVRQQTCMTPLSSQLAALQAEEDLITAARRTLIAQLQATDACAAATGTPVTLRVREPGGRTHAIVCPRGATTTTAEVKAALALRDAKYCTPGQIVLVVTNIVGSDPNNEFTRAQLEDSHTLEKAMVESGQIVNLLMPDIQWSQDAAAHIERISGQIDIRDQPPLVLRR